MAYHIKEEKIICQVEYKTRQRRISIEESQAKDTLHHQILSSQALAGSEGTDWSADRTFL